jgi:ribonuclease-3
MREPEELAALQARLGVEFRDEAHLLRALRHRSAVLDRPRESNERMEFLGDSIVGMIVCDCLFARFPESSEGDLAKAKAFLVSEPTLAEAGRSLGLDRAVEISPAEEASGGRARRSIVADAFEAVVAAVYLDQGIRTARRVVRNALAPALRQVARDEHHQDFKSLLQERLQATRRKAPRYRIAEETGADHDKTFVAQALAGSKVLGEGTGKSKKQAEQAAALNALEKMKG